MAAPKGNQYAKDHGYGRPREYDLNQEAAELLEFAMQDTSITLERFTFTKPYLASELCEFAKKSEVFAVALTKAKELIGARRQELAACNQLNTSVYNRTARLYCPKLRKEEEDTKDEDMKRKMKLIEFEYKVKSEAERTVAVDIMDKFNQHMMQIDQLQESSSKIDKTSASADHKS